MKALVGVLIFATIFGLILLLMLVRFVYRIYSKVRDAKRAMEDTINNRFGQNDTGRRSQQYQYNQNGRQQRSGNGAAQGDAQPRRTQTESGEVIIDSRHQERENKKIFADDDGEYVDYVEG